MVRPTNLNKKRTISICIGELNRRTSLIKMSIVRLVFTATMISSLHAETIYTIPQGYTKVTIAAAASNIEPTITGISVTLLNDLEFASSATINSDYDPVQGSGTQTLGITGQNWSPDQWTGQPHLAYITDANGAEEAFLISSNTGDGQLTLLTTFDLLGDKDSGTAGIQNRFPSSTTVKVRAANTIGSIFSSKAGEFSADDRVFVWDGSEWLSFQKNGFGNWALASDLFGNENGTVIFPDEGMFILRSDTSAIELTLFGEVPAVPQISTITKTKLLSTRIPVETTLAELGVNDSLWKSDDRLYIWNGSSWDAYLINGFGNWAPANNQFGNSNDLPIAANAAIFVNRETEVSGPEGIIAAPLPYDLLSE